MYQNNALKIVNTRLKRDCQLSREYLYQIFYAHEYLYLSLKSLKFTVRNISRENYSAQ